MDTDSEEPAIPLTVSVLSGFATDSEDSCEIEFGVGVELIGRISESVTVGMKADCGRRAVGLTPGPVHAGPEGGAIRTGVWNGGMVGIR